jgi:heme exporter protein A
LENTIELTKVVKKYGTINALRDISIAAKQGTITAISGHNGSGKSTLLKLVSLQSKPTSGNIRLFGEYQPKPETRQRIGYLAHECFLYGELTVLENLSFYHEMFSDERSGPLLLNEAVESLNIKRWLNSKVKNLSHGSKKRVDIARALLHRPKLLVLDEPFSGLDPQATELFIEYLTDNYPERTVLLSSQDLPLIQKFCNTALILQEGKIAKQLDYR